MNPIPLPSLAARVEHEANGLRWTVQALVEGVPKHPLAAQPPSLFMYAGTIVIECGGVELVTPAGERAGIVVLSVGVGAVVAIDWTWIAERDDLVPRPLPMTVRLDLTAR